MIHCDAGSTDHDSWTAEADIYHQDTDGSIMAYDYGYRGNPAAAWETTTNYEQWGRKVIFHSWDTVWLAHATYAGYGMVWFDLDLLPKDVEILSAELCMTTATQQLAATYNYGSYHYRNGLHAVLDTLSADRWVDGGTDCNDCDDPRYRDVSWYYQDTSEVEPWNPTLADRTSSWNWGVKSKTSGPWTPENMTLFLT